MGDVGATILFTSLSSTKRPEVCVEENKSSIFTTTQLCFSGPVTTSLSLIFLTGINGDLTELKPFFVALKTPYGHFNLNFWAIKSRQNLVGSKLLLDKASNIMARIYTIS